MRLIKPKKILCLCSGGFDSVVMANYIRENNPKADMLALFFDYGQKSVEQERRSAKKCAEKLNMEYYEIKLPKFEWTSSEFYSPEFSGDKEYLEMRNLIFLSYALSVCESKGYNELYMAVLKSISYYDTSNRFLDKIREIAKDKGIDFVTPFSDLEKQQLAHLAYKYMITSSDFFSCDNPVNGEPCGECPDCETLKEVLKYVPSPHTVYLDDGNIESPEFRNSVMNFPNYEVRVYVNHDCQLSCEHCYYGYEKLRDKLMTLEEYEDFFKQAKDNGFTSFHFSGKEPLYDDRVFSIIDILKRIIPTAEISFVTNGINIPKYIDKLIEVNPVKICLSVDDILTETRIRKGNTTERALSVLQEKFPSLSVEVFIVMHEGNYESVGKIVEFLYEKYKVKSFDVRALIPIGNGEQFEPTPVDRINAAYIALKNTVKNYPDIYCTMRFNPYYTHKILDVEDCEIRDALLDNLISPPLSVFGNVIVDGEFVCQRYVEQITLTADGYVQGCASESCFPDYYNRSAGNIREKSLWEILNSGKEMCLKDNKKVIEEKRCFCMKPLDKK